MDAEMVRIEREFDEQAQIVDKGAKNFIEVGEALEAIRDRKLYLVRYTTFEECVRDRWGWTRQNAYRKIKSARVTHELQNDNLGLQNERQARALADVPKEKRKEVLADAGEKPTAKTIEKAAAKAGDPTWKPKVAAAMGEAIEFTRLMAEITGLAKRIKALEESQYGAHFTPQLQIDLRNVWRALKFARPYGPCGYCNQRGCKTCKGQGWWTESIASQAPKDLR